MIGDVQSNPYGSIYRYGFAPDGRVIYGVIDSDGKSAGQLSIPKNEGLMSWQQISQNIT